MVKRMHFRGPDMGEKRFGLHPYADVVFPKAQDADQIGIVLKLDADPVGNLSV